MNGVSATICQVDLIEYIHTQYTPYRLPPLKGVATPKESVWGILGVDVTLLLLAHDYHYLWYEGLYLRT